MTDELANLIPDRENIHRHLGIETMLLSPDEVILEVEISPVLHQPFGIVHGGVYALLAEGAASMGGAVSVDEGFIVVGTELNCSHLRPALAGRLRATATPIRKGRTVQVWSIAITDERERLISTARCSLQVVKAPARA